MDERIVKVSLHKAKGWYKSSNKALKEVALQAFSEEELTSKSFRDIKTFEDALQYLKDNNICRNLIKEYQAAPCDSYSEKICKYRIIVAALTHNEERHLTTGERWFPVVQFCKPGREKNCYGSEIIGTIESEGQKFTVVGGSADNGAYAGLGDFNSGNAVSDSWPDVGFRSVSRREIAEHISKHFGRLLFEVHYGGINCDWKWIS